MPEYDCRRCKRWKGCEGKTWYDYGDIRFCPQQVIWILQHSETLRSGMWVHQEQQERAAGRNGATKTEAHFVKPELIVAEVEDRLQLTGTQGYALVAEVAKGRGIYTISEVAWEVLMYVKGWRRKALAFGAWKRQRKYRKMITEA